MLNQEEQIITRKAFARLNHAVDAVIEATKEKNLKNNYGKPYKREYTTKVLKGQVDDLPLEILIMEVCKKEITKKGLLQQQKEAIAAELADVPLVVNNHRLVKS